MGSVVRSMHSGAFRHKPQRVKGLRGVERTLAVIGTGGPVKRSHVISTHATEYADYAIAASLSLDEGLASERSSPDPGLRSGTTCGALTHSETDARVGLLCIKVLPLPPPCPRPCRPLYSVLRAPRRGRGSPGSPPRPPPARAAGLRHTWQSSP